MGGLFGIGGSSAKTDRKMQLQSWGDLMNLFGNESRAGGREYAQGTKTLQGASDFWKAIMSGDPSKISSLLAPQISQIRGQAGQNIAGLEQFSGRSGGTSGAVQAENVEAARAVQNLMDLLLPEAVQQETGIGEFQTGAGLDLLGMASANAAEVGSQASSARPGDQALQQSQQASVLETLGTLVGLA